MPKVWLPTCVTTIKPPLISPASFSRPSKWLRPTSGRSLSRNRRTRVSLMRSMRCSLPLRARTSSIDRQLRNGKAVAACLDDQCRDDGERERNFDGEAQSRAGHRLHVDGAADLIDIVAHNVHADAAAGNVGDFRGGGEAGREDELVNLRFRQFLGFGFGNQTLRDGLGLDARRCRARGHRRRSG